MPPIVTEYLFALLAPSFFLNSGLIAWKNESENSCKSAIVMPSLSKCFFCIASLMDYLERVKSEASSQYEVAYIESQIPKSLLEKIPRLGLKNINDMTVEELKEM